MNIPDFPPRIQIQTSNLCNGYCIFCPNQNYETSEIMPLEVFEMIIDQCRGREVIDIIPFFNSEPLTVLHIHKMCRYTKKVLPESRVSIYTNGSLLSPIISKRLIDSGLDYIHISLQGFSSETYASHCRLDRGKVFEYTKQFLQINQQSGYKTDVAVNMTVTNKNRHEVEEFIDFWKKYLKQVEYKGYVDIAAHDVKNRKRDADLEYVDCHTEGGCSAPFNRFHILVNGDVSFCCEDWKPEVIMGNIFKDSIYSIWHGKMYQKIRELHKAGRKREISVCRDCKTFL